MAKEKAGNGMENDSNEDQIIDNIIQVFSSSLNSDLFLSKDIVKEKLNLVKTLMVTPPSIITIFFILIYLYCSLSRR